MVLNYKKIQIYLISGLLLFIIAGCTLSVDTKSLKNVSENQSNGAVEFDESNNDKSPSTTGIEETVTTQNGVVIKAKIGEIVDRQILSNGVVIEGVLYE